MEYDLCVVKTFIGFSVTAGHSDASTNAKAWGFLAAIALILPDHDCGGKHDFCDVDLVKMKASTRLHSSVIILNKVRDFCDLSTEV